MVPFFEMSVVLAGGSDERLDALIEGMRRQHELFKEGRAGR
jgi:hypothetical protein